MWERECVCACVSTSSCLQACTSLLSCLLLCPAALPPFPKPTPHAPRHPRLENWPKRRQALARFRRQGCFHSPSLPWSFCVAAGAGAAKVALLLVLSFCCWWCCGKARPRRRLPVKLLAAKGPIRHVYKPALWCVCVDWLRMLRGTRCRYCRKGRQRQGV